MEITDIDLVQLYDGLTWDDVVKDTSSTFEESFQKLKESRLKNKTLINKSEYVQKWLDICKIYGNPLNLENIV